MGFLIALLAFTIGLFYLLWAMRNSADVEESEWTLAAIWLVVLFMVVLFRIVFLILEDTGV